MNIICLLSNIDNELCDFKGFFFEFGLIMFYVFFFIKSCFLFVDRGLQYIWRVPLLKQVVGLIIEDITIRVRLNGKRL